MVVLQLWVCAECASLLCRRAEARVWHDRLIRADQLEVVVKQISKVLRRSVQSFNLLASLVDAKLSVALRNVDVLQVGSALRVRTE